MADTAKVFRPGTEPATVTGSTKDTEQPAGQELAKVFKPGTEPATVANANLARLWKT